MIRKALVVDDDSIMLDILQNILERNGYDITRASDGDEAIGALNIDYFELVITDLEMGKTSGFEVIRKAKNASNSTIVIMLTGSCEEKQKQYAYHYGADDFFQKPFSITELLDRIQLQELIQFHSTASTTEKLQKVEKVSG